LNHAELDDAVLTRYLLGEMSEAEREAFEARMLADPELSEAIAAVETDLIDEYLRGELDAGVRRKVEIHLLATEAQRARLRAAQTFQQALAPRPAVVPMWRKTPRWLPLAAAALIAFAAALTLFVPRVRRAETPVVPTASTATTAPPPVPIPTATEVPAPVPAREPVVQTLILVAAVTRSDDGAQPVTLRGDADVVRFAVGLPEGDEDRGPFRVVVQRVDGTPVADRNGLAARNREVQVEVPRASLQAGDYEVLVQAGDELLAQHALTLR
jgi:anti-sigma factor RsiW